MLIAPPMTQMYPTTVEAQGLSLRVSASERPEFENHFFGAQIVQIVIEDPGATDPDESTVGLVVLGVTTPRVHLSDGLWYSYVAEDQGFSILLDVLTDGTRNNSISVSKAVNDAGSPVNIGGTSYTIVTGQNDSFVAEIEPGPQNQPFAELNQVDIFTILPQPFFEVGTTINPDLKIGTQNEAPGAAGIAAGEPDDGNTTCTGPLSSGSGANAGDSDCDWPYIRLLGIEELGTMEVRAGTTASVVLIFDDLADSITSSLDRLTDYPLNAEVINSFTDFMWNINPVEEDVIRFALNRATGNVEAIVYEPIRGFDPDGTGDTGENIVDFLPVFTSSPGMEFDERQVLELDREGVQVLRFINWLDRAPFNTGALAVGTFVAPPFTFISENARLVSQFDDPDNNSNGAENDAFIGTAAANVEDEDLPIVTFIEKDPNAAIFETIDEQQGGRAVVFTGVNDRVASWDYFDIINSSPMTAHDGFTSVDREVYDSGDRAVFTVTDSDQNLRSRISEEPSGRESSTFIRVGNPFPLVNTQNTSTRISNTALDTVTRLWAATFMQAGTGPSVTAPGSDSFTFGITAGFPGANVFADVDDDNVIDIGVAATEGTERFHADGTDPDGDGPLTADIVEVTNMPNTNRQLALVFTPPLIGDSPATSIMIDTTLTIDSINDFLDVQDITGNELLGQVRVDNLFDETNDQLENFLVQVARIEKRTTSTVAPVGAVLGQTTDEGIIAADSYNVRMPKYNLVNVDLTDLQTTFAFAKAVVKIDAIDPSCISATVTIAFGVTCVHASQVVDFQIVEAAGVDTDGRATTGDDTNSAINEAAIPEGGIDSWSSEIDDTIELVDDIETGFDRDPLTGRTGVGAFRPLDLERVADLNDDGIANNSALTDRIRVTLLLLAGADAAPVHTVDEPASTISAVVQRIVIDFGGLGTIFDPAPTDTAPDAIESPIGHAFSNLAYRLELDEDGSNSSLFTGRADFFTFLQHDTVPDVLQDIVLTGDPLRIWLPNRFIPPNRLAFSYVDEDIVQFFREVSATFIYETRDGSVEWDRASFSFGQDAFLTITDEDLNRKPDATERYGLPLDGFVFFELGKQRVCSETNAAISGDPAGDATSCALRQPASFFNQIDATLLETSSNTGIFVAQITMPSSVLVDPTPGTPTTPPTSVVTQQQDLEANYIDIRDRSSVRQEFDDITNIRTTLGDVVLDRAGYPPSAIMYAEIHDNDFNRDVEIRETLDLRLLVAKDATAGAIGTFAEGTLFGQGQTTVPTQCDQEAEFSAFASSGVCAALAPILEITIFKTGAGKLATLLPFGLANMPADGVDTATATGLGDRFGTGITTGVDATPRAILPILDRNGQAVTTATETGPNTGIFEFEVQLPGPTFNAGAFPVTLPAVLTTGNVDNPTINANQPIQVTYTDPADESGEVEDEEELATFLFNTASFGSDKPAYHLGEQIILWIVEPDRNLDSRTIEFIPFSEFFVTTDKADALPLDILIFVLNLLGEFITTYTGFVETDPNSGVFAILAPEGVVDEVVITRGEQAEIEFFDKTPSGGGTMIRVEYEIEILEVQPEIIFDKEEYTPFDEVEVRIISPDSNSEPPEIDTIKVLVSSSSQGGFFLNMPETGLNTGIFEEDFDLTPNKNLFLGDLVAQREDGISAEFRIDEDTVVTKSVFVNYHVGNVIFDRPMYGTGDTAIISVIDPDENRNPDTIDTIDLRIWSTSDRGGLLVTLRETGDRTGIFEEFVTFTTDEESTGTRLRALDGDTVTAKYTDRTLPAPAALDSNGVFTVEVEELFASSLIGATGLPLERAPASEPILVDQNGLPIEQVEVDQQVLIQSEITNNQNVRQKFAYIVQVKDSDSVTISLSWVSGELPAKDSIIAAQSWIPEKAGSYEIGVFVWESVDNPVTLSPTRTVSVTVS